MACQWRSKVYLNIFLRGGWLSWSTVEYVEIKLKFETTFRGMSPLVNLYLNTVWSRLSWILLETVDFFALLSWDELQQQSRILIQFQPVYRLHVEPRGPRDLSDMAHLGALNHLDSEALGACCSLNLLQLVLLLVCLDLLQLVPLDFLYLGTLETFCWLICFPVSALGVCCQLNLFQLEAFDFSYFGGFGLFWHFDPVPAWGCCHLGELLVFYHFVSIPLALDIPYQLVLVELGSLASLYLAAHVLVKLGVLFFDSVELLNLGQDSPWCHLYPRLLLPANHHHFAKKMFPPKTWSRMFWWNWSCFSSARLNSWTWDRSLLVIVTFAQD